FNDFVVSSSGKIVRMYDQPDKYAADDELLRIQRSILADPRKFAQLLEEKDDLPGSITVYSWDGEKIVEDKALAVGHQHITASGVRQENSTHFASKHQLIKAMIAYYEDAKAICEMEVEELERQQAYARRRLADVHDKIVLLMEERDEF